VTPNSFIAAPGLPAALWQRLSANCAVGARFPAILAEAQAAIRSISHCAAWSQSVSMFQQQNDG